MSEEREQSPDWLQCFQAPAASAFALSSDSDYSPDSSPTREGFHEETVAGSVQVKGPILIESEDEDLSRKDNRSKTSKKGKHVKGEEKDDENGDGCEESIAEDDSKKPIRPTLTSRLPLVFPEKVQRQKALVECDGDSLDLSGDVGAVGRVIIANTPSGDDEMLLDLKGTIYKSAIVPSRTFCIVSFGQTEAKIEAIMTDYVQLKRHSNVFEAETMIEGTLEGFSFDSEDEADKLHKTNAKQDDEGTEDRDQTKGKSKRRKEKSSGPAQKKAKFGGKFGKSGKQTKRPTKKPQTARKGKASKK